MSGHWSIQVIVEIIITTYLKQKYTVVYMKTVTTVNW